MSRVWLRWAPAGVAVVLVAGAAVAVPTMASASVNLPHKTVAQVLKLVASSKVTALSGTVAETSDLGLPSLPTGSGAGSGSSSGVTADLALLTGSNSLRVYVDGPTKVRVQDLESLAERDLIRSGSDVWIYDSKDNSAAHATLSAPSQHFVKPGAAASGGAASGSTVDPAQLTPEGIATTLLAQLRSSSAVAVAPDAVSVAGRAAYDLVLTPKATDTLLGSVSIAVDASTGLPLRVEVAARGQKTPAISIGFSQLTLSTPAASLFEFTAPKGAKVTQLTKPTTDPKATDPQTTTKQTPTVTGTGWDAVVAVTSGGSFADLAKSPEFAELTTAVAGGRVLHTSVLNVLFTADGRILAGSVSVARLQAVANAS